MMIKRTLVIICACISFSAYSDQTFSVEGSVIVDHSLIRGESSDSVTRGLVSLGGLIDLTAYLGENSHFSFGYAAQRGKNGSDYALDIQAFSNIDEDDFSRWYEVYLQFSPMNNGTVKIGQIDVNSDFAASDYAGEFIQSSMGFSPTIYAMPTYPQPVYGISFSYIANDAFDWSVGVFDGSGRSDSFEEVFSIAQINWHPTKVLTARIGGWLQSGQLNDNNIGGQNELFAIVDYRLSESAGAFIQLGSAGKQYAELNRHVGVGLETQGLFFEQNSAGIGLSQVSVTRASKELALAFFYSHTINEWINVKFDFQHIDTPSGDKTIENANIVTIRTEFSF